MKSVPVISIGVPAYNEESRIEGVIRAIYAQEQSHWKLGEVIVILDGCTDNTLPIVKRLTKEYPSLIPIVHEQQKGKTYGLQELFHTAQGDIIVMFDADISFLSNDVVSHIVQSFSEKNVCLVGGNSRPETPKNFFQKCVSVSFSVFNASRLHHLGGHNIFCANGACLAVRTDFAKTIQFPKIVNEDSYLYFLCKSQGKVFRYQPKAIVEYLLPSNPVDYLKQVLRSAPGAVESELKPYFPEAFLMNELTRNRAWYLQQVALNSLKKPLETAVIITLNLLALPVVRILIHHYKLSWFTAKSTHTQ